MKQFIITWTTTIEADSMEAAMSLANKAMDEGSISPEIEELEESERVAFEDSRDDSDYIDIIERAKATWFEAHPEVDAPTTEETDEEINKALGLNASGSLRGLALDLVEMSDADIAEAVADGLDNWFNSIINKCEDCSGKCPHCGAPVTEIGCSNGSCEAVN